MAYMLPPLKQPDFHEFLRAKQAPTKQLSTNPAMGYIQCCGAFVFIVLSKYICLR